MLPNFDCATLDGCWGFTFWNFAKSFIHPSKQSVYLRKIVNGLGRMTIQATMGWDNTPDENNPDDKNATYFKNDCTGKKCYKTPDGTVPFSVIIGTILCPPVGVFMEYGLSGWFNILIAGLLTLLFYFPGLIYALILLYC